MTNDDQDRNAERPPDDEASPHGYAADAAEGDLTICPTCGGAGIVHLPEARSDQPTVIVWGDGYCGVADGPALGPAEWTVEFGQDPEAPKVG